MTKIQMMLAQTQPAGPAGNPLVMMVPYLLLFAAMYFFLIAPQRKKQKAHEKMLSELKTGDEVVTAGGIYGTITGVKEDRFVVRVGDNNAKVEIGKGFISALVKKGDAA
ncbi:MAG: preprotein translocase subunit YajC [Opitutaceae bacterium]|nr:preprotein translocase subunit YajC [Opitutaceae bacterium]